MGPPRNGRNNNENAINDREKRPRTRQVGSTGKRPPPLSRPPPTTKRNKSKEQGTSGVRNVLTTRSNNTSSDSNTTSNADGGNFTLPPIGIHQVTDDISHPDCVNTVTTNENETVFNNDASRVRTGQPKDNRLYNDGTDERVASQVLAEMNTNTIQQSNVAADDDECIYIDNTSNVEGASNTENVIGVIGQGNSGEATDIQGDASGNIDSNENDEMSGVVANVMSDNENKYDSDEVRNASEGERFSVK